MREKQKQACTDLESYFRGAKSVMYSYCFARRNAGLKFKLDLASAPDFAVFVQSTSHNRIVDKNTKLLYKCG